MPEAIVIDTRTIDPLGDRIARIDHRNVALPPVLLGGWVAYCAKHDLGQKLPTRNTARLRALDTLLWCHDCIREKREALEPGFGVDLSTLRSAQSSQCSCSNGCWKHIRNNLEDAGLGPRWVPRCTGCGAVPSVDWYHEANVNEPRFTAAGVRVFSVCWCGFRGDDPGGDPSEAAFEQHLREVKS